MSKIYVSNIDKYSQRNIDATPLLNTKKISIDTWLRQHYRYNASTFRRIHFS